MPNLRILITDDHAYLRLGLRQLLERAFNRIEIGEAGSTQQALEQVWKNNWDLVIMDINMPGRSGLECLKEIKSAKPKLPVLILSMQPETEFAVRAIKSGASGFLPKGSPPEDFIKAVNKILAGGKYLSDVATEMMLCDFGSNGEGPSHQKLSDREYQVFCMIASGKTVSEIAAQLNLSVKTISTYRAHILEKMNLRTNSELTHYAFKNHLVE